MTFNSALLNRYRTLLQTTDLQMAYQEFIRFFRYLRTELEKQMPDCKFQGGIVENAMEYAYFSLTNDCLRTEGLKIVVAFVHKTFQLEVWISGVNRKVQCSWKEKLEISLAKLKERKKDIEAELEKKESYSEQISSCKETIEKMDKKLKAGKK